MDAQSVDDPDWRVVAGHYEVMLDGEWLSVPDHAVVKVPNKRGIAMVWPNTGYDRLTNKIRCFMPGVTG